MAATRLLLLSNSTNPGEPWLGWPEPHLRAFLGEGVKSLFFVPFAGVRIDWDEYAATARKRFTEMGCSLVSAHETEAPLETALRADGLVVGGGNTFHLLYHLRASGLLQVIRERALAGVPFIGWSAGTNVACPTIMTTNDMPVVQPDRMDALDLVPFQINPHYTEERLPNHGGETRVDRLLEFIAVNRQTAVLGLPEATALRVEGDELTLLGSRPAKIFHYGVEPVEVHPGDPLSDLLK